MVCKSLKLAAAAGLLVTLFSGFSAHGAIINGSFEAGSPVPTGWSIIGLGGTFGAKGNGPTDGVRQVSLLTGRTGSGGVENTPASPQANVEAFLSLSSGALDLPGIGDALEGSAIRQVFQGNAGDILSFDWNFLPGTPCHPNPVFVCNPDFVFVSLVGTDGVNDSALVQSVVHRERTVADPEDFQTFAFALPFTGTYTLGIGVMDAGTNNLGISELLADNVKLTPALIPEPDALTLLAAALVGLTLLRRRRRQLSVAAP